MKRALFLIFFISLSSLVCKGQEYPDISYDEVESSRDYVNGNPTSDLMARGQKLISGDNEIFKNSQLSQQLQLKDFWEMCGYDDDEIVLTFEDNTSVTIPACTGHGLVIEQLDMVFDSPTALKEVPFCYAVSDSLSICYLQFNMCYDSLNYPQLGHRFDDFVEEMMAEIKDKSIQTLVVDVRNNFGQSLPSLHFFSCL